MLHASTQKLIDRLAAMTAQNKIDWIEKDNGEVIYATEGYVVRLTAEPPRVLLTTESGKPLEDATSTLLKSAPHAEGGTYGDLVASIARQAYREARGTEDAINTLLAGLSDEAEIGSGEVADEAPESPEEMAVVAPEGAAEPFIEDEGDETEMLASGEFQSDEEEDTADVEPAVEATTDAAEDTPQELADESVPETALVEPEVSFDAEQEAEPDAGSDSLEDEDDVSGAVARLADEVNGVSDTSSEEAAEDEQDHTVPIVDATSDDLDAEADTEPDDADEELVSFSVRPDEGQTFDIDDDETDASIDTLAQSDLPADAPEDATLDEVTEEAAELAAEPVETQWSPEEEATVDAEAADFAEEIEEPASVDDEPQTVVAASEPQAEPDSTVRYVPFGAAGLAVAGADASEDEMPVEEDISSELGAASTTMTLPADAEDTEDTPVEFTTGDAEDEPGETPSFVSADANAPEDALVVDAEAVEEDAAQSPEPTNVMSISGFSAGLGFGATATGFTPSAPKVPDSTPAQDSVTRAPVIIDATDDYPADFRDPVVEDSSDAPGDVAVAADETEETFASFAPVAPETPEDATETDTGQTLETVDAGGDNQPDAPEVEEDSEPARPKTRFNPWT